MARFKKGMDLDQGLLLPPSLRDWLPKDHLAWFVADAVNSLDIDELLDRYRMCGKGELPYDPRMMLRVLIYGYSTGVTSSRKIAKQLEENVAFRVLAGNQMPSHRTICRFRERHLEEFKSLFAQVVRLAAESGLTKIGKLAIDGSKLKANASKHKAMSYQRMKEEEARLKKEIEAILTMASEKDAAEDVEFGPDFRGDELPEELRRRETRLQTIQAAKERLERRKKEEAERDDEKKRARAEREGRKPPKDRPKARKHPKGQPKPKDQENFTDPESRIMKTSAGFQQCYNVQIAVEGKSRLIVGAAITNCSADGGELLPMIENVRKTTGERVVQVLADAGYRSEENLEGLEQAGIDGYVALGREGQGREPCRLGQPATARMHRKLSTEPGRRRYRERKHLVEPVFGWIKNVLGFRQFGLRGMQKVAGEFHLLAMALNLRRMKGLMA